MNKKFLNIIIALAFCFSCIIQGTTVFAENEVKISMDSITSVGGETVNVPIIISGNTGICGATITVSYDSDLTLNSIAQGDALSNLTLTKPGNTSANPFILVWDGMEADSSNGTIVTLSFAVPSASGEYNINLSYGTGDIVDGSLTPISPSVQNGKIIVSGGTVSDDTITVGSVTTSPNSTVEVPIVLSGSVGICGASIKIAYDSSLKLTDVVKGAGLANLTMTKQGNINENPYILVWDGMEEDKTKGTIATLVFTAPEQAGIYNVNVSYQSGDIVDGNLKPINLSVVNGGVSVVAEAITIEPITTTTIKKLTSSYKFNISSETELNDENVIVAVYNEEGRLINVNMTTFDGDTEGYVTIPKNSDINCAKVFVWEQTLNPIGGVEKLTGGF